MLAVHYGLRCGVQATGDKIKKALQAGGGSSEVQVELDWKESIAHPDNRCAGLTSLPPCSCLPPPHKSFLAIPAGLCLLAHEAQPLCCLLPVRRRVEWELWFTAQDGCGQACDSMRAFFQTFKDTAESLERVGE
jgi:hypothetical protein